MGQITLQIPQVGQPDSTEDPKVASDFTTIQATINGGLDGTNLSALLAQSATVNQAGQVVKGTVNIPTSQSTTSTSYTTLSTHDEITGLVLPTNGLIRVWYQATWQESVAAAARAAIFIGTNQLLVSAPSAGAGPVTQAAANYAAGQVAINRSLSTFTGGLISNNYGTGYTGDATTGQVVGQVQSGTTPLTFELAGVMFPTASVGAQSDLSPGAGCCDIFAAAGTYSVSVKFKASSGSVTASNRKLWVQVLSFA